MDHYVDIQVLHDPEFLETTLMNELFSKLHRALGKHGQGKIGVSFPDHGKTSKTLGARIRLHGSKEVLEEFMQTQWITGMTDYCRVSAVRPVPPQTSFCTVRRVQVKSAYNKRKRSVAKGWLDESEAQKRIPDSQQRMLDLPYAQLRSLSNGSMMRVYIEHSKPVQQSVTGSFSAYGLSSTATVPWF